MDQQKTAVGIECYWSRSIPVDSSGYWERTQDEQEPRSVLTIRFVCLDPTLLDNGIMVTYGFAIKKVCYH